MANVTIKVLDSAPLLVTGDINLVDGGNAPFCDGSHVGSFQNVVRSK